MRKSSRLGIRIVLMLAVMLGVGASSAMADSRCGGERGTQVYTEYNGVGGSKVYCIPIRSSNLMLEGGGLNGGCGLCFSGWNDIISSIQIFNNGGTVYICYYRDAGYNGTKWSFLGPNVYGGVLPAGVDDQISAISSACP